METVAPPVSGKSYAAVVRVSTNNASVQTNLTWPNTEYTFKRVSEIQKAQRQVIKASLKQASRMKPVSSDSSNPTSMPQQDSAGKGHPTIKTMIVVNLKKAQKHGEKERKCSITAK